MTRAPREPSYARVLADFFVLRQAIQLSKMDSDLKESGVQIVYFVDPSLVELYVEPAKWAKRLAAFPSLSPDEAGTPAQHDTPADMNALRATALLTGEYIFSRTLVGTLGDLYVSPDHFSELLGYVQKVEGHHYQAVKEFEREIENSPELADEVVRRIRTSRALKNAGMTRPELVEPWRKALVASLAEVTMDNLVVTRRLFELLDQGLLATASVRDDFTLDVLAPARQSVQRWIVEIRQAKARNRTPNAPEAIEADGVTLEQLWLLNQASSDTRYVLITDDAGLHTAYQRACRQAPDKAFYALRRPIQFTPILNLQDMGGQFGANGSFQKIEAGVESIAQTFTSSDEPEDNEYIVAFLDDALPSVGGIDGRLNSMLVGMADEIRNEWKQLVHYASSAKADLLAERALEDDEYWSLFVRSRPFRQRFTAAATSFRNEAVSLSASSSLLRHEIWALHAAGDAKARPNDFNARQLATSFAEFESHSLRGRTLDEVVEAWRSAGADAIEALKQVEVRSERLLCVGVLCLQIGAWGAAFQLLHESVGALPANGAEALRSEAHFFHAVAARLSATDRHWRARKKQAETSLALLRRRRTEDSFAKARLASEGIALTLCQLPWFLDEGEHQQIADGLRDTEIRAADFLKNHLPDLSEAPRCPRTMAIIEQVCLNVFCMIAWRLTRGGELSEQSLTLYRSYQALFTTEWVKEFASGPHAEIYPNVAEIAVTQDPAHRSAMARTVTETIDRLLARDIEYSFAFDMPAVDKKEFAQFKTWLQHMSLPVQLEDSSIAKPVV